jgi:hypothetical protein
MMIIYVAECLEGRFLFVMVSLKIALSPNFLARTILLVLAHPYVELTLNSHILQMVPSKIGSMIGSILVGSLMEPNHRLLLNCHPQPFSTFIKCSTRMVWYIKIPQVSTSIPCSKTKTLNGNLKTNDLNVML